MSNKRALKPDLNGTHPAGNVISRFLKIRAVSEYLAKPISHPHMEIQTMPDVSPTKWHLAHTTWFFEAFILQQFDPDYRVFDEKFNYLFNSYYEAVGDRHPRPKRGEIKDPDVPGVLEYRAYVTEKMADFATKSQEPRVLQLLELGCHHEEQHQELLLTDIKHALYFGANKTPYHPENPQPHPDPGPVTWAKVPEGIYEIGCNGESFSFDCERPRHKIYQPGCEIASRPITQGEYLAFMEDGGYERVDLWLSDGWVWITEGSRKAPLYWEKEADGWTEFTMRGMQPVDPNLPVCHLSYYEAEAFARWAGARLPSEAELEIMALQAGQKEAGEVWEWTGSAYLPYPGFKPNPGAVGEYNGKFMCSQMVLRGGSGATPKGHWRPTYRNFFYPSSQWQFTGVRLAK